MESNDRSNRAEQLIRAKIVYDKVSELNKAINEAKACNLTVEQLPTSSLAQKQDNFLEVTVKEQISFPDPYNRRIREKQFIKIKTPGKISVDEFLQAISEQLAEIPADAKLLTELDGEFLFLLKETDGFGNIL